jgi:hypothetical protein
LCAYCCSISNVLQELLQIVHSVGGRRCDSHGLAWHVIKQCRQAGREAGRHNVSTEAVKPQQQGHCHSHFTVAGCHQCRGLFPSQPADKSTAEARQSNIKPLQCCQQTCCYSSVISQVLSGTLSYTQILSATLSYTQVVFSRHLKLPTTASPPASPLLSFCHASRGLQAIINWPLSCETHPISS